MLLLRPIKSKIIIFLWKLSLLYDFTASLSRRFASLRWIQLWVEVTQEETARGHRSRPPCVAVLMTEWVDVVHFTASSASSKSSCARNDLDHCSRPAALVLASRPPAPWRSPTVRRTGGVFSWPSSAGRRFGGRRRRRRRPIPPASRPASLRIATAGASQVLFPHSISSFRSTQSSVCFPRKRQFIEVEIWN